MLHGGSIDTIAPAHAMGSHDGFRPPETPTAERAAPRTNRRRFAKFVLRDTRQLVNDRDHPVGCSSAM